MSTLRILIIEVIETPSVHNIVKLKMYCRGNDRPAVHQLVSMFENDKVELVKAMSEVIEVLN